MSVGEEGEGLRQRRGDKGGWEVTTPALSRHLGETLHSPE